MTFQRVRLTILSDHSLNSSTIETLADKLKRRIGRVNFQASDLPKLAGEAFSELLKEQKIDSAIVDNMLLMR